MAKDTIIDQIRAEIERQGISWYEVSKRSGVPQSTLQRVAEDGWGQQIETAAKVAGALGMKLELKKKKK